MTGPHRHEFTALWSHFGPHAPPERAADRAHFHVCFDRRCGRVLIGQGRDCDGRPESHREERL